MKSCFRYLVQCIVLIICHALSATSNRVENFFPNDDSCGIREESSDIRTLNPWNLAIFMRTNPKSEFKYFITGTLASANTAISGFGGDFGHAPYNNRNKTYYIPPPNRFLIVTGLKSTSLQDADQYTQFSNVSYIAPYPSSDSNGTNFHFVIFRLTEPVNLKTPYVRSACQPFATLPYFKSIGFEGKFTDIITEFKDWQSFISGFNASLNTEGPQTNIFLEIKSTGGDECYKSYKFHYNTMPDVIFCIKVPPENASNSTCLSHGSGLVWPSTQFLISILPAFGPTPRYFYSGAIGLIPGRDRGQCGLNTIYYVLVIYNAIYWMKDHMLCANSQTFPCKHGICIPLDQLCDGKQDCQGAEDENPIFCAATKRCTNPNDYQCGYEGQCIRAEQVGDGKKDCPSGSDEDPKRLQTSKLSKLKDKLPRVDCFPLIASEGVILTCNHPEFGNVSCSKAPEGTEATLRCAPFYSSLQKVNFGKMKCYDDKTWKPFRAFICQPECGLLGQEVNQALVVNGIAVESGKAFPWHGAIFKERKQGGHLDYMCGASLIERNVLITAAHCTTDEEGIPVDVRQFRIVLNSISTNLTDNERSHNAQIFEVEQIWRPYSYNAKTLQSDVAVIKLSIPVNYTPTIRPVCYLLKKYRHFPHPNSTGTVPGFGVTETGRISLGLNYVNLNVLASEDGGVMFHDKFCAKAANASQNLCFGDSGGGLVFATEQSQGFYNFVLKGVVSDRKKPKGFPCGPETENVSRFTHLDSHAEWLLTTLEETAANLDF